VHRCEHFAAALGVAQIGAQQHLTFGGQKPCQRTVRDPGRRGVDRMDA
jgi:hypothetical protein